jgi:hypothetical protein
MPRPGTEVVIRELPPPRGAPTDVGVAYVVGLTERGPLVPALCRNMSDYVRIFGDRVTYGFVYDWLDGYFHEGGRRVYVSRVVGPAAIISSKNLLDGTSAISLVVTAKSPGDWGNTLGIAVVAGSVGGSFVLVLYRGGVEIERSTDLLDNAAAVAWGAQNDWVTIALGASALDPAVVALSALTGGTDDRVNAVDANWQTALDAISKDLGPGQVSMPGRTTGTAHTALLNHAEARNRVALLDLPDSSSKSTLKAAVAAMGLNRRWGAAFSPWAKVPGVVAGTTRTIPYSAIEAGIIARNDVTYTANVASAGDLGMSLFATGLSQVPWSDADREDLNEHGVDIAITKFGGIRTYGYRTVVDPVAEPNWVEFSGSRLLMQIAALGGRVLESHVFDQIDGRGRLFSQIEGEMTGILQPMYEADSLYGSTPAEAFNVDASYPNVNTDETIAARELHLVVAVRISPFAEFVQMELVKVSVQQTL